MATEVLILRWCDVCAEDDRKMEAEQVNAEGLSVDLYTEHRQPFDVVAGLLSQYGYREASEPPRPVGRPRRAGVKISDAGVIVCPECLQPYSAKTGTTNILSHLKKVHGVKMTAAQLRPLAAAAKAQALKDGQHGL